MVLEFIIHIRIFNLALKSTIYSSISRNFFLRDGYFMAHQKSDKTVSTTVFLVSIVILVIALTSTVIFSYTNIILLQEDHVSLYNSINILQSAYSELHRLYQNLQSANNEINSKLNNLLASHSILESEHNELKSAYQELIGKAPIGEGIRIDSIYRYKGVMSESGIRNVVIRNLCSEDVTVISMKLYLGEVLQASGAFSTVIPANSTVQIERFLPPSQYDRDHLYILKVETLEGYVATSDPLPLCQ